MEQANTNANVSIGSLLRNRVIQTLLLSTFFSANWGLGKELFHIVICGRKNK
jgi:hypothetical protein